MAKEFVQHDYKIDIDDNDHSIRKYFLNDKPLEFVDPKEVKVGTMVWFDLYNQTYGIVQELRHDKFFPLYDVLCLEDDRVEEVASFRVYRANN